MPLLMRPGVNTIKGVIGCVKKVLNNNILSLKILKGSTINWNDILEYFQSFNFEIFDANQ